MPVVVIETYAEFEKLRANWEAVYDEDPEAQFFLSWTWLAQVFLHHDPGWFVLAVRQDENSDFVAFFPLCTKIRRHKSSTGTYNEIAVAGRFYWADYSGFICRPEHDREAIAQFSTQLKKMDWRKIRLKNIANSKQRLRILLDPFERDSYAYEYLENTSRTDGTNLLVCPRVALPDSFEAYLGQNLSANSRQKLRRLLRDFDGSDALQITVSEPATQERDIDILIDFWKKKWAQRKGRSLERLAARYREILQRGMESETLYLPVLWRGGKPLGALAIFVDRQKRTLLYFIAGRDETCGNPSPGLVLHAHSIRWAIGNGFTTYDFLRGDERFKYSLGGVDRQIRYLEIRKRSRSRSDSNRGR